MLFSSYLPWLAIASLSSVNGSPIDETAVQDAATAKSQKFWLQVESREAHSEFNGYYLYLWQEPHSKTYRFGPVSSKAPPPSYTISDGTLHTKLGKEYSTDYLSVSSFLELVPGKGKSSGFQFDKKTDRLGFKPSERPNPTAGDFRLCPHGKNGIYVSLGNTPSGADCEKIYVKRASLN